MPAGDFWSYYEDPMDVGVLSEDPPSVTPPPGSGGTGIFNTGSGGLMVPPGGGGGGGEGGGDFPAFSGSSRFSFDPGNAPRFRAPTFRQPTFEEAQNEPGYAFSLDQGVKALNASAAAKGTLNTGGTLKDTVAYGQKLGAQNYQNVFNRALSTFDRLYQGQLAEFQPLLHEWTTKAAGGQRAAELAWLREWQLYQAQLEKWKHLTPSAGSSDSALALELSGLDDDF